MTNQFRAAILSGQIPGKPDHLPGEKDSLNPAVDKLGQARTAREDSRAHDHRWNDRHFLAEERAKLRFRDEEIEVELVNLSGGGAMVRGEFELRIWERVDLVLGKGPEIECAVRWIRGDRAGLEFAHETQVRCDANERNALLLEVIRRNFPDAELFRPREAELDGWPEDDLTDTYEDETRRTNRRHPLIWMGEILYNHSSDGVRLRNISETGAMIEGERTYPENAELMLDLGEAGQMFATVAWSREGQTGLIFQQPFDVAQLAMSKPTVAPSRWARPTFLRNAGDNDGPWAAEWERASIDDLRDELGGFLGR